MSRKNGQALQKHPDVLRMSSMGLIDLLPKLIDRMKEIKQTWLRVHGELLTPPQSLMGDFQRFNELCFRHAKGDLRDYPSETLAVKAIAQWALDVKMELCNQAPKKLDW